MPTPNTDSHTDFGHFYDDCDAKDGYGTQSPEPHVPGWSRGQALYTFEGWTCLAPLTEQEKAANDAIYADLSERIIAAAPAELIEDCAWWGGAMDTQGFVARLQAVCAYPGGRWTDDHFRFNADPEFPGYGDNPVSAEQAAFALTFCQELHQTPGVDEARLHHEDGACKFDWEYEIGPDWRTRDLCGALGPAYKWNREFDRCEARLPELEGSGFVVIAPVHLGIVHAESKNPAFAEYDNWYVWLEMAS